MRCKNCEYCQYDRADDMWLCEFGFEEEDSKGRCGCKYNRKTLNKMNRERLNELEKECLDMARYFGMEVE